MRVISINIGKVRTISINGRPIPTAFEKRPVEGPVRATRLRLEGDCQANLQVHGGLHKAVYAYPYENYASWASQLDREPEEIAGYGENLTLEGLLETQVGLGDRLRIGAALFEVSEPREPCFKFEAYAGKPGIAQMMIANGRCGFYLRVLEEGMLQAGDSIEIVETHPARVTISELFPLLGSRKAPDRETAARALQVESLSPRLRRWMQQIVAGMETSEE
jgi:MOSC domain-containing protein YiiM